MLASPPSASAWPGATGWTSTLLRLSVDPERLVADGRLTRRSGPHPSGTGTASFYETFGAVLVEPPRPRAKGGNAGVSLTHVPAEPSLPPRGLELAP